MGIKKAYQSKIVWTNVIASIIALLSILNQDLLISLGLPASDKFLAIIGFITTVLNLLFRIWFNNPPTPPTP